MEHTNSSHGDLEKRVQALEHKVHRLEQGLRTEISVASEKKIEPIVDNGPTAFSHFWNWMKQDFLMKLGAFMLILALAWFVRYSFVQNWLGPVARITLGLIAGLGLLVFGYKTIPGRAIPGQVLTATGATTMLITLSAGYFVYGFFDPYSVLVMMSLIVVLTAVVAIVRNTLALAILALIGGAVAPFMAGMGDGYPFELLSYIFLVDLGVLLIVAMRGWRRLLLLAIMITSLYSMGTFEVIKDYFNLLEADYPWGLDRFVGLSFSYSTIYVFMGLFFGLFFVTNLLAVFKTKKVVPADLWTKGINAVVLLFWIENFVPQEWKSLVLIGVALLAVITSYLLMRDSRIPPESMYIHSALAVVALGVATAFELEGTALVVAFAFESLAILFLATHIIRDSRVINISSFLVAVPIVAAFENNRFESRVWAELPFFNEHLFVLVVLSFVLFLGAYFLKRVSDTKDEARNYMDNAMVYFIGACACVMALIWLTLHNVFNEDVARGVALVVYALIGVSTLFRGVVKDIKNIRHAGSLIIGGVVLRLLLVEVWLMPLSYRVVTFVLVGLLLVATAFFQKKHLINK